MTTPLLKYLDFMPGLMDHNNLRMIRLKHFLIIQFFAFRNKLLQLIQCGIIFLLCSCGA